MASEEQQMHLAKLQQQHPEINYCGDRWGNVHRAEVPDGKDIRLFVETTLGALVRDLIEFFS